MKRLLVALALLAGSALGQEAALDQAIEELSAEDYEVREAASHFLLDHWRDLDDVRLFALASPALDIEAAERARTVVQATRFRRLLTPAMKEAVPRLQDLVPGGHPDVLVAALGTLAERAEDGDLSRRAVVELLRYFLDDDRLTSVLPFVPRNLGGGFSPPRVPPLTLCEVVSNRLEGVLGKQGLAPEDWPSYWGSIRDLPERDWYLPLLDEEGDMHRANLVRLLVGLNDPIAFPRMFAALRTVRRRAVLEWVLPQVCALPGDLVAPALRPMLESPNPWTRLVFAQHLFAWLPEESVAAVIRSVEHPEELSLGVEDLEPELEQRELALYREEAFPYRWLATSGHRAALEFVFHALKSETARCKWTILACLARVPGREVDEALVASFDDPDVEVAVGPLRPCDLRIGDVAASILGERLQIETPDLCDVSPRRRDRWKADVLDAWREKQGLGLLPIESPRIEPVAPEVVHALLSELGAEEEGRRTAGVRALLEAGPCAWPHLVAARDEAEGPVRDRLEAGLRALSNRIRSAPEGLGDLVGRPFDPDTLARIAIDPLLDDPRVLAVEVDVDRDPDGLGIVLSVRIERSEEAIRRPGGVRVDTLWEVAECPLEREAVTKLWREGFLGRLEAGRDWAWIRFRKNRGSVVDRADE